MTSLQWFYLGVPVAASLIWLTVLIPHERRRRTERILRSLRMPPTESLDAAIESFTTRRWVAGGMGGLIAYAISFLLVWPHMSTFGTYVGYVYVSSWVLGTGLGTAIGSFVFESRRILPEHRVARSSAVGVDDFVSRFDRYACACGVALGVIIVVVNWWVYSTVPHHGLTSVARLNLIPATTIAGIAIIALLAFEVGARIIVSRGQRVASEDDLLTDDALRSLVIGDLWRTSMVPIFYGLILSLFGTLGLGAPSGLIAASWILSMALGAAFVIALARTPQRRFLRMLWPRIAADNNDARRASYEAAARQ